MTQFALLQIMGRIFILCGWLCGLCRSPIELSSSGGNGQRLMAWRHFPQSYVGEKRKSGEMQAGYSTVSTTLIRHSFTLPVREIGPSSAVARYSASISPERSSRRIRHTCHQKKCWVRPSMSYFPPHVRHLAYFLHYFRLSFAFSRISSVVVPTGPKSSIHSQQTAVTWFSFFAAKGSSTNAFGTWRHWLGFWGWKAASLRRYSRAQIWIFFCTGRAHFAFNTLLLLTVFTILIVSKIIHNRSISHLGNVPAQVNDICWSGGGGDFCQFRRLV